MEAAILAPPVSLIFWVITCRDGNGRQEHKNVNVTNALSVQGKNPRHVQFGRLEHKNHESNRHDQRQQ